MQQDANDLVKCDKCEALVFNKVWQIHQLMCTQNQKSMIKPNKKKQGFFQMLFGNKTQEKQESEAMIPCTQCGESIPFSVYAQHEQQCIGHQLTLCLKCNIKFPTFLFEEHTAVCQGQNQENQGEQMQQEMEEGDMQQLENLIQSIAVSKMPGQILDNQKGLSKDQLANLRHAIIPKEKQDCPICCTVLTMKKRVVQLNCSHVFHFNCISAWLKNNPLCPMCRTHALKK